LPEGTAVQIRRGSWPVLTIFQLLQDMGKVEEAEMYRTFNMGIGMVVICSTRDAAAIRRHSEQKGTQTFEIGSVIEGDRNVSLV
jgi:phosphoribosylformylglycinamidine cyclo-ligase